jgi:Spy/CpxP family protein refolding chaperone
MSDRLLSTRSRGGKRAVRAIAAVWNDPWSLGMNRFALAFATALSALPAAAEPVPTAPYAGLQSREIKALSGERTEALRQGRGIGMALAAELNGYPGPMHTLELADALRLTDRQRAEAEDSFDRMQRAARALGEEIIASERALDALFASGGATEPQVRALTDAIAATEGRLRAVHLNAHVEMVRLLSSDQVSNYRRLRGYAALAPTVGHGRHRAP